jgi:hypothetical protein
MSTEVVDTYVAERNHREGKVLRDCPAEQHNVEKILLRHLKEFEQFPLDIS